MYKQAKAKKDGIWYLKRSQKQKRFNSSHVTPYFEAFFGGGGKYICDCDPSGEG